MYLKLSFTWAPGLPETTYSYKDGLLTVDDFSFQFPDGEDGEAVGISEESGGKILQAYRKDGENYAIIHYLCKSSTHPNATGEFFDFDEYTQKNISAAAEAQESEDMKAAYREIDEFLGVESDLGN